jgi:aldose 1-epimerase
MDNIKHDIFGKMPDGKDVGRFILNNSKGITVKLITLGATLISLGMPDKKGEKSEVILGYDNLEQYLLGQYYFGATIGRFANRIAGGTFRLDNNEYQLACNENGLNHLHGGYRGFDKVLWEPECWESQNAVGVSFTYFSPNGEEGYPGNLNSKVIYSLNEDNELKIEYYAKTDKATIVNMTNHSYWNLSGTLSETVLNHELTLNCNKYLPVDNNLIPTGEIRDVYGTPMDFSKPKIIGKDIANIKGGYDHCYVIDGQDNRLNSVAMLHEPKTGRTMEVLTTKPGIQLYSGNKIGDIKGANGVLFHKHSGLCLETEFFPNSINENKFPSPILYPGKEYNYITIYHFFISP